MVIGLAYFLSLEKVFEGPRSNIRQRIERRKRKCEHREQGHLRLSFGPIGSEGNF